MQWQIQEQTSICRLERQGYGKCKFLARWCTCSMEALAESCELLFFSVTLAITLSFWIFWQKVRVHFYKFLDFDGCKQIVFFTLITCLSQDLSLPSFFEIFPYENLHQWTSWHTVVRLDFIHFGRQSGFWCHLVVLKVEVVHIYIFGDKYRILSGSLKGPWY